MTEETSVVAETQEKVEHAEQVEKQVPLKALEAERKKRQEAELRAQWLEEQAQKRPEASEPVDEYEQELEQKLEKRLEAKLKNNMEREFLAKNPEIFDAIQERLPNLLKQKPWLAHAIQNAPNRYEEAMDLLNKYSPRTEHPNEKRLEDNAKKPNMGQVAAKPSNLSQLEQLKGMDRKEFSQWRAKMLGRSPNIR